MLSTLINQALNSHRVYKVIKAHLWKAGEHPVGADKRRKVESHHGLDRRYFTQQFIQTRGFEEEIEGE